MEAELIVVMEILDVVHLRIGLTHSFVYYSGCGLFPLMGQADDM